MSVRDTSGRSVLKVDINRAFSLLNKRLLHAALEAWNLLAVQRGRDTEAQAQVLDGLGVTNWFLARNEDALKCFEQAVTLSRDPVTRCNYLVRTAIVHGRLHEYDRALRVIRDALNELGHQNIEALAFAYGNLSFVQGQNGFYKDSLESAKRSLELFEQSAAETPYAEIYNNIGLAYLEEHCYEQAEEYLLKAVQVSEGSTALSPLMELSRLYFLTGDIEKSVEFGLQAMQLVWSSIVNYDKEDIARLCRLLANVSYQLGERAVALRLLEKAGLMFGQLGMWREWDQAQSQLDEWYRKEHEPVTSVHRTGLSADIERFVRLLDVMNAQELLGEQFSELLDARVLYANVFADALQLSPEEKNRLVYVCRFADYGLTALEPDVVANPQRSSSAWEQYQRHPELSSDMLQSIDLEPSVAEIIVAHHEHYDGTGYPNQRTGSDIPYLARLFAVVDHYATGVVVEEKPHSVVLTEIRQEGGRTLDPGVVAAFERLFT
jgi:tetratricopeptide (TPR) repeat protein